MLYLNVRYKFAAPDNAGPVAGGIIAASAMPMDQLMRRDFRKHTYLQHRLLDPQLYLSGIDSNVARGPVVNLVTFPWFAKHAVPAYDSDKHGTLAKWKSKHSDELVAAWKRAPPVRADMEAAARAAVQCQLDLGCNAVILPTPLTTVATQHFQTETEWIDVGLAVCKELRVTLPVFATVALSDTVLRGVPPHEHPLLHTITNQIASREQLAGAYLVLEQTGDDQYVCTVRDSLMALMVVTDDLVRGASRQVIANYLGTFGAVLAGAGASIWSSGYYLSQRRMKLADFDEKMGLAKPRYFSMPLAGDVGVDKDLPWLLAKGLADRVFTKTTAGEVVQAALAAGTYPHSVPQWEFRPNNIQAAASHYTEAVSRFGAALRSWEPRKRVEVVHRWLAGAVRLVDAFKDAGLAKSYSTELIHQRVWLDVFEEWRQRAGM